MKILHLAPKRIGQAANTAAAWRILLSQQKFGLDATALTFVTDKLEKDLTPFRNIKYSQMMLKLFRSTNALENKLGNLNELRLPWTSGRPAFSLNDFIVKNQIDVLNIHWIPNTINIHKLIQVKKVSVVLTLHDVWPLTGGCHCNLECANWENGCKDCFQFKAIPYVGRSPENTWNYKLKSFSSIEKLGIIGPSKWITEMAQKSPFFKDRKITTINNPIPETKSISSKRIKTKANGRIKLIFIIAGSVDQYHKGFDLLTEALTYLSTNNNLSNWDLTVVGSKVSSEQKEKIPIKVNAIELISGGKDMAEELMNSNILINSSRQDNFPNVILESLIQGVPCAAFAIGGIPEIIKDGVNGFLAEPFNPKSLARAIGLSVEMSFSKQIRREIRRDALTKYNMDKCALEYSKFYNEMIN